MTAMAYKGSGVAPTNNGGPGALFAFGSAAKMAGAGMAEGQQGVDGIRGGALEPLKYVPYAFEAEMPEQPRFSSLSRSLSRFLSLSLSLSLSPALSLSPSLSRFLARTYARAHIQT